MNITRYLGGRVNSLRRHWPKIRRQGIVPFAKQALNAARADVDFAMRRERVSSTPVAAQIELTNLCNFTCDMCIRDRAGLSMGSMNLLHFKKMLDKLPGLVRLQLQGQGEPFVHKELFPMISEAARRGIDVTVTSNGSLLNAGNIAGVVESGLGCLAVSIDDWQADAEDAVRHYPQKYDLIGNMKAMSDYREERGRGPRLQMWTVLRKDNLEHIPKYIDIAAKTGFDEINFQRLVTTKFYYGLYPENMQSQMQFDMNAVLRRSDEYSSYGESKGVQVRFGGGDCDWPWRSIYVSWNGAITPCCVVLRSDQLPLGNLLEDGKDFYNHENYQKLRKSFKDGEPLEVCRDCYLFPCGKK